MRVYLTCFIFMAFFSNWLRADVYKEQRTGVEFPATMGNFKRGKVTPYEVEPGKPGVGIQYQSADAEITVYVRSSGGKTNVTSADFLNETLAGIKALEANGQYSNVKIYGFNPEKERPGWASAAFTSSGTNHFLISFIYCKATAEHLVKIRATTGNPNNELLQSVTKSLQELVDQVPKNP